MLGLEVKDVQGAPAGSSRCRRQREEEESAEPEQDEVASRFDSEVGEMLMTVEK